MRCFAAALHNPSEVTTKVFFDVNIGDKEAGRITIGLYGDSVPKTTEVCPSILYETVGRERLSLG